MERLPLHNQANQSPPTERNRRFRVQGAPLYSFTILLLLKMLLLRYFFFEGVAWGRLGSDLAAIVVLLCVAELLTPVRSKRIVFWIVNLIVSLLLFSSSVYFAHFGSVPTYTALMELNQVAGIKDSVKATIELSHYLFFADIVLALVGAILLRLNNRKLPAARAVWKKGTIVAGILGIVFSALFIKSGLQIDNELAAAENQGFINYEISAAIKSKQESIAVSDETPASLTEQIEQLKATYPYTVPSEKPPVYFGTQKGRNVIVIQMEAFQNFPINLSIGGQEVTPVLNGLMKESFYFPHVFQQIGQGNTSDAEFMSNTSIYPTGKVAMSTGYGDRELPSLPRLLESRGYEADTFHVNEVTFWDRNKLYPALHFDHYFDKPYYTNDNFNGFGASDEELYRVGVEKLTEVAKTGKPFYAQFVTVSSHFPFDVPKDRQRIELPDSLKGTQLGKYIAAVNYTDYAIGTLIDRLKANGLWDNTVLVAYGDHFGLQPKDNDAAMVSKELGITYEPNVSRFNVPLLIRVPGEKNGKVIDRVGGQLDIMPTLANLLGVSLKEDKYTAFGQDLLNIDRNVLGMRYYLPTGSFFNDDVLFIPGKSFDDGKAISLKTLQPVSDIAQYRSDYDYVMKLMTLSDQYVQVLPKRAP
ncbi:LTA synthase family protein [Cohnella faecalis]|uniref:LTA synthase family protein n=1 Tax=Cohnella faecalis TaxID=2315694 RepID=A0A398CU62_9BACL|nr:LTA synthase family protein [Cohnella faecalis]RIE03397.1 LTA synthase family protein [Cohnella faecalis]